MDASHLTAILAAMPPAAAAAMLATLTPDLQAKWLALALAGAAPAAAEPVVAAPAAAPEPAAAAAEPAPPAEPEPETLTVAELERAHLQAGVDATRLKGGEDKAAWHRAVADRNSLAARLKLAKLAAKEAEKAAAALAAEQRATRLAAERAELTNLQAAAAAASAERLKPCDNNALRATFWAALERVGRERADLGHAIDVATLEMTRAANACMLHVQRSNVVMTLCETHNTQRPFEHEVRACKALPDIMGSLGTVPASVVDAFSGTPADVLRKALKGLNLASLWLRCEARREVDCEGFWPTGATVPAGARVYNTYAGPAVKPGVGNPEGKAAKMFEHHIRHRICNGNEQQYAAVLAWTASLVQQPGGQRPGWALILRGEKGCGKTFYQTVLSRIIGRQYCREPANAEQIIGRFNSSIADALLICLNEVIWAGDKTGDSVLKMLITEDELTVEKKGLEARNVRNSGRVLMTSNGEWVVPASGAERRYQVQDVSREWTDNKVMAQQQVTEMLANIEDIAAWLYAVKYDERLLRHATTSEALEGQIMQGLNPVESWLSDEFTGGSAATLFGRWKSRDEVFRRFSENAGARGTHWSSTKLYISLRKMFPQTLGSCKKTLLKKQVGGKIFNGDNWGSIEQALTEFRAATGLHNFMLGEEPKTNDAAEAQAGQVADILEDLLRDDEPEPEPVAAAAALPLTPPQSEDDDLEALLGFEITVTPQESGDEDDDDIEMAFNEDDPEAVAKYLEKHCVAPSGQNQANLEKAREIRGKHSKALRKQEEHAKLPAWDFEQD